jgi:hypothetical protein
VRSVVIDFAFPDPLIVVPLARFEHVADESVKLTGNVSINGLAPAGSAVTSAMTKIAGTRASRLMSNLLSLPDLLIHLSSPHMTTGRSVRHRQHRGGLAWPAQRSR